MKSAFLFFLFALVLLVLPAIADDRYPGGVGGGTITNNITNNVVEEAGYLDVKDDYGAVCDGVTDDTVAIQNAINDSRSATTAPGTHRLQFPRATCRVSQIYLKTGTWLQGWTGGVGTTGSVIKQLDSINLDMIVEDPGLANNGYLHGIVIRDLRLDGADTPGTGSGIRLDTQRVGELAQLMNLTVEDFTGSGIAIEGGCEPCYFENLHLFRNGNNGLYVHRDTDDVNSMVYMNHISGDANTNALIEIERSGGANNRESYVITGVKSECAGPNQLYAVKLDTLGGSPVTVTGVSHGNTCAAGAAAIRVEGGTSDPRLVWSGIDVDTTVTNWISDAAVAANTVARTADSHWGVFGMLRGSSWLFEKTASPQGCNSSTKGATYYDTASNTMKVCIDDGSPNYDTINTTATAPSPLLVDATHVWIDPSDNFQTECTNLAAAADAADTDGYLFVQPGTYTVTTPLNCTGTGSTEMLQIACLGGPMISGGAAAGAGSACKILPASSATVGATVTTGFANWTGFYVEAEDDSGDSAMIVTSTAELDDMVFSYPDRASNPATKYVVRVDATAAATPVVEIRDSYLELTCVGASSECDGSSSMVRADLGETGNMTDNVLIENSRLELKGTTGTGAVATRPAVLQYVSGDDFRVYRTTAKFPYFVDPVESGAFFIRADEGTTTRFATADLWFDAMGQCNESPPGSGSGCPTSGTSQSNFAVRFVHKSAGGDLNWDASALAFFTDHIEDHFYLQQLLEDQESRFEIATDGDLQYGNGSSQLRIQLDPDTTNSEGVLMADGGHYGSLPQATPGFTCAAQFEGTFYFDSSINKMCVCTDRSGAFVWETFDNATVGTSTNCG